MDFISLLAGSVIYCVASFFLTRHMINAQIKAYLEAHLPAHLTAISTPAIPTAVATEAIV
jgi:hypothetical protein